MKFEIIYDQDEDGEIFWLFRNEAESMRAAGICVGTQPSPEATRLLRRGCIIDEGDYPEDSRYLQDGTTYENYSYIKRWYPLIENLTIPTVFTDDLGENAIRAIEEQGWSRAFVKNSIKSLVEDDPLDSVWPDVAFSKMKQKFDENSRSGPYALRKYLPPETFTQECRYWVMGSCVHHSSGNIPEIVKEAAVRLAELGGILYTIDATPELVVEVNSGESSDRKTDNTAKDFTSWIKKAFDL